MNKNSHKKMTGIDVYICIDNSNEEKDLTLGRPYRVLLIRRDNLDIKILVKTNKRIERWFNLERFRPRNNKERK
jgi:hypothetical protein